MELRLWKRYNREEIHSIFSPTTTFTPQAGTWGLQGIVKIPDRPGDYVFLVSFGTEQNNHLFDESITKDGVLTWQSQPKQSFSSPVIQELIAHDERTNSIHLFLRRNRDPATKYSYLGTLGYLTHDLERQEPVYFQWQLLDWPAADSVIRDLGLDLFDSTKSSGNECESQGPLVEGFELSPVESRVTLRSPSEEQKYFLQSLKNLLG